MDLIAGNGHRKWAYGVPGAVLVAALTALIDLQAAAARPARPFDLGDLFEAPRSRVSQRVAKVPLPRPRPDDAPQAEPAPTAAKPPAAETDKPVEQAAPAAPAPSACRAALTEDIAIAPSIPDIRGPGGCGGTDLVRLEAIILPNKHRVAVTPAATLRCTMATAIADWVRTDIVPLTEKLGSEISALDNFDSYECRGFNRVKGAHLSEHGHANALDVRAFKLADGRSMSLTERSVPREFRESVLRTVCPRFMTVLGPGSDWYHEDHIHLDLMERRNNYKICQWNVYDPLPQVAPQLPAERPEEAPPREVADKAAGDKGASEKDNADAAAKPDAVEAKPADGEPAPAASPAKKSAATKKRRW